MTVTGSCLCKAVRYEIDGAPLTSRTCWCRICQQIGSSNGTVNACFSRDALRISGPLSDYSYRADSGTIMHCRFCVACGVHVFITAESRPNLVFMRASTLDDPEMARPLSNIWVSQAPSWAVFDERLPKLEGQPAPIVVPT